MSILIGTVGAVLFGTTFDGWNGYGKGTNTTTIAKFRPGKDDVWLTGAFYTDGTRVTTPDTNGDGAVSTGDKGWTVLPTAKPVLRFQGWNSTLFVVGVTFLDADAVETIP